MFRWSEASSGCWVGADGDHWYRVLGGSEPDSLEVDSNAEVADFERLFRLDIDSGDVESQVLERGPELQPYIAGLGGLRLMRPRNAIEVLFSFLCSSNNHVQRISAMVRHLGSYGSSLIEIEGHVLHAFPAIERLAELTEDELRTKGFGYRGATIPRAARQLVDRGTGWLEELKATPYDEAHAELLNLSGVGPKLADCICLYALGHTEAVPIDTHMWQAATRVYFPQWEGLPLTDARYRELGRFMRDRFGSWAGWAQQYLFVASMMNSRAKGPH